jgi:hypothetical protein
MVYYASNEDNKLNRKFSKYLEAGPVPKAPDAPLPSSVDILNGPVQCSQSKVDAVQMFAMQMCHWEGVVHTASSRPMCSPKT